MKAIVLSQYGTSNVLQLREVDTPVPDDDEVLVNVRATAVNDWDWCLMRGAPFYIRLLCGLRKPNISILGAEIAGLVEKVGKNVTRLQPGDAVYGDISECGFGGFAEYVCVPATALALKPDSMTFAEAAALPHAGMLALQGLREAQLQPEQTVLINGAGGGVGTLGVQIANDMGSTDVTGVDHSNKLAMMRSSGFVYTIDYTQADFTQLEQRYDVILDAKTNRSVFEYLKALNPGGAYVTVGGATGRLLQTLLMGPIIHRLFGKRVRLVSLKPNQDLDYINRLFEAHQLEPVIDGPYPLSQVPELIQYFGEGQHKGKVVISVT
ncbi:MAG: NAD(P)-dependent alcohol dehydrogenase [Cyanobacteria bacterium P01_D01_bin.14]